MTTPKNSAWNVWQKYRTVPLTRSPKAKPRWSEESPIVDDSDLLMGQLEPEGETNDDEE